MNKIILDGKVLQDNVCFDDTLTTFTFSIYTGEDKQSNKGRYTYIRVVYPNKLDGDLKLHLNSCGYIRIEGKLDSEKYISRIGKTVYNKILVADKITPMKYNKETQIYTEV